MPHKPEHKKKKPFQTDVSLERKKQFDIRKKLGEGKDFKFQLASQLRSQGERRFDLAKDRPDIQAEFARQDLVEREAFEKRQAAKTQITQLLALAQKARSLTEVRKLQNLANQIITEQEKPAKEEQVEAEKEEEKGFLSQVGETLKAIDTLGGRTLGAEAERKGETLLGGAPIISPAAAPGAFSGLLGRGGAVGKQEIGKVSQLGGKTTTVIPGTPGEKVATLSAEAIAHRLTRTAVAGTNILQREQLLGIGVKTATRSFIGKPGNSGVTKLFSIGGRAEGAKIAMNTKTMTQAEAILSGGVFSNKAMVFFGAWASAVFLGRWARAEAAEPITFPLRDALRQAERTGDFSIYDEYAEAAREITDVSIWKEIALWSPLAPIPGIADKVKGVRKGIDLLDAIADKAKEEAGLQ